MSFRIFGVKISVSFLFVLMLTFLLIIDTTGYMTLSLLAVVLHEAGHLVAMHFAKCKPKEIQFQFLGILIVSAKDQSRKQNFWVSLFGPLINIVAFAVFGAVYLLSQYDLFLVFGGINLILALINLAPIRGLDGGSILSVICETLWEKRAEKISFIVELLFSVAAIFFSVFLFVKIKINISLVLLSIYLFVISIMKFIK